MGKLIQNHRKDVRSAGRSALPHDQANANAQQKPCKNCGKQIVFRQSIDARNPLKQGKQRWIQQRTCNRTQSKFLSKHPCTQNKEQHIKGKNSYGKFQPKSMLKRKADAGRTANQNAVWNDKRSHRQSVAHVPGKNSGKCPQMLFHRRFPHRLFSKHNPGTAFPGSAQGCIYVRPYIRR